jgi:hypothetical protein
MIEGIETILVYGKHIPLDITVLLILCKLKTSEKRNNFIDTNNQFVRKMKFTFNHDAIECSELARTGLKYKNNYQVQCKLIGADFLTFWYYYASYSWFVSVMGYLDIPNQSDMSRAMKKHAKDFKREGVYTRDSKYTDDKNNLIRFKEYKEAISFISRFMSIAEELSKTNQQMKELLIERDNILIEVAKSDTFDPHRICRFCMSVYDVKTSNGKRKHCGSPDCDAAYIRASRHKNHPKRGWIHDPTASQPCIGSSIKTCGSNRKQLNSNRVCFGCYDPFS